MGRGYGQFGKPRIRAHRVSWELAYGPIPDGRWVLHKCDNPGCVNPDHLFLGDAQTNEADKVSKDRQAKGETVGAAVLTTNQVLEIRKLYRRGDRRASQAALARRFGVDQTTVGQIVRRFTWKHV